MRIVVLAMAAGLALVPTTATYAAPNPSFAACDALAVQRGSKGRGYREFMRECRAGRVPLTGGNPPITTQGPRQSREKCNALALERGSVGRGYREFMRECMAGRVPI